VFPWIRLRRGFALVDEQHWRVASPPGSDGSRHGIDRGDALDGRGAPRVIVEDARRPRSD
jgi:hypothetical protein